jgi:hypothetical protein
LVFFGLTLLVRCLPFSWPLVYSNFLERNKKPHQKAGFVN